MKGEKVVSTVMEREHGVSVSVLVAWSATWVAGQTDVRAE